MYLNIDRQLKPANEWNAGLFDCFDDTELCLNVWFCGNCVFGKLNEIALQHSCCICCFIGGIMHPCQRQALVAKYQIQEPCIISWIIACYCGNCSLCQMANEVQVRENGKFGCGGSDFAAKAAAGVPASAKFIER